MSTKTFTLVTLAVVVFWVSLTLWIYVANSAEPDLCRPYATATANTLMKYVWQRAYTSCLNQDEMPPAPPDWYNAMCIILPDCEFAPHSNVPVDPPSPNLDDHDAKCAKAHPRGWDPQTKTITQLVKGKWIRVPCP